MEFVRWRIFFQMELEDAAKAETRVSKQDIYLARIAWRLYHLHRRIDGMFSKTDMPNLTDEEFLLKFVDEADNDKTIKKIEEKLKEKTDQEVKEEIAAKSRSHWSSLMAQAVDVEAEIGEEDNGPSRHDPAS